MKYVVDSGIFMNLSEVPKIDGTHYICNSAINEIKSFNARQIWELFQEENNIVVLEPDQKSVLKVEEICKGIGQTGLSQVDIAVLALLLFLNQHEKVILLSDDYALRNVAHALKIESKGYKTQGGGQFRQYLFKCKGCQTIYDQPMDECDVCGHNQFIRSWKKSN